LALPEALALPEEKKAATNKRCPNGYRRDKSSGECVKALIKKPVL